MKSYNEAGQTLSSITENDPLDFRAANEAYLIAKESGNSSKAEQKSKWLAAKMRDDNQNYLNLAVGYLNDGLLTEAEDVLSRYKGEDPIISYYLGFISL